MNVILGEGEFRYEVVEGWGALPSGWNYGDVGGVGVDRNDTQVTTANEAGDFLFLNLLPDTYNLKVTMDSFKTVEQSNVVVNAADRLSVGVVTLELGAVSETVNVSTRVVEVQSRDATRTFSVDSAARCSIRWRSRISSR